MLNRPGLYASSDHVCIVTTILFSQENLWQTITGNILQRECQIPSNNNAYFNNLKEERR